jgi:L-asparaginase II
MAMNLTPEPGRIFTPIEHNCSAKHAGMLAVAVHKGLSLHDYLDFNHPVQQLITKTISEICRCPEERILIGQDGCSAPNHALPLYNMALGFARLITPNAVPKEQAKAYSAISMAMMEYPEMVAGTGRFDTVVATSPGEQIISKAGAEGVQCFAMISRHLGTAIKITDGAQRALYPVAIELLYKMGVRTKNDLFNEIHRPIIKNWRNFEVGYIEPGFEINEVEHA